MNWLVDKILKHRVTVILVFSLILIFSVFAQSQVKTNYNVADYLPEDSHSTISLNLMKNEFDKSPPNVRIMLKDVSIAETLKYKKLLSKVEGVKEVNWLDDNANIDEPLEMIDKDLKDSWYKDNNALLTVLIDEGDSLQDTIKEIRKIVGNKGVLSGSAVTLAFAMTSASKEISKVIVIILPVIILILIISTSSWFEPFLFLIVAGISVVINTGTNIFLGEISFITKSTSSILQLAVSMDYAIFLLHRFAEFRREGMDVKDAMSEGMKKSFISIFSSGLTTIFGFIALTLMRFKIGPDLGIVLAKGIIFSLTSVMFLLPVLTTYTYKIIEKTQHKNLMPSFDRFSKFALKIGPIVVVIILLAITPAYLAQQNNHFTYGASSMSSGEDTSVGRDTKKVDDIFGKSNQLVLMIPKDDPVDEKKISNEICDIEGVTSVISYSEKVGNEIPKQYIQEDQLSILVGKNYSRMIITVDGNEESDVAFESVKSIRKLGEEYFNNNYFLAGGSASAYDIKQTVTSDNVITTLGAIISIGLIIMITYKSLSIPLLLLIAIEASIWINLSFSYFTGTSISFIGYMVISAVQLGATVDYAILFANGYLENRKIYSKHEAAFNTLKSSTGAILTSSSILSLVGFVLGKMSSNKVIAGLGILIGRGAILSAISVFFFLPTVLVLSDTLIRKTTLKSKNKKGDQIDEKVYSN